MALKLEIQNKYGVINDYWRIDKINADFQLKKAKVTLNGYANKEKLPMQTKIIEIDLNVELAKIAYEEIKKLEQFKESEDILEESEVVE